MNAVRRPLWRLRLKHWARAHGPATARGAVEMFLTAVLLLWVGGVCYVIYCLGG